MLFDGISHQIPDIDPSETSEWIDSFDEVVSVHGRTRARFLLMKLLERARSQQVDFPSTVSTPYVNSIPPDEEPWFPGDENLERRIRAFIRWNAAVMVTRANARTDGIGGHLSTYASSAALYEVGFNHFFRGKDDGGPGDQVYLQGHASPGIYARAYVEGRLTESELDNFRHEVGGNGLPSYPHPRSLPHFWEYPTVSMGLGPIAAIYQAHVSRYLHHRRLVDTSTAKVWCFVGDGEMDEPESIGALGVAGREHLDNLIFVVNCNLQRLDGPVRGNGKIIQELEAVFRGAGWNVIKVIWGSRWDDLLARDVDGVLLDKMNTTVDGEFQKYAVESGAYIRENFFGPDPRLRKMVEDLTDDELRTLPRGGHDYRKLYAAYKLATEQTGAPTAILAKTIKGWTLGPQIEARNATHQIKKMSKDQLLALRDRLHLAEEIPDSALESDLPPYYRPPEGSEAYEYLMARRKMLAGPVPNRVIRPVSPALPSPDAFSTFMAGSGKQSVSTTMAFSRLLRNLVRDPQIGPLVVPIVADEARTFGLESIIAEVKIYAPDGQRYTPVDADLPLSYAESSSGQVLQEGITEAGALATFTALATSYATWGRPMLPVFLFYSMFGFQRVGDLLWALGDIRGRGILAGCTAGRTTLLGEGLQHDDGHSPLLASTNPAAKVYDPAFAYEMAIIVEDAIGHILGANPEDHFWYITLYNETYPMPSLPANADPSALRAGVVEGMYRFAEPSEQEGSRHATICFSGPMWQVAQQAREILLDLWGVSVDTWSVTSWTNLRTEALSVERYNRLHPAETPRFPLVTTKLGGGSDPVVAVSDYMRAVPDQLARFITRPFVSLGTDGFGRSDAREALRRYFEVDTAHVVIAVLSELFKAGKLEPSEVERAIKHFDVDPDAVSPFGS
ncbi:MAG: pyruvate dehydrogenase (acetyl-transferring), homodimeric type [Actinobacteria bacterium]|nr:pyruvate dehydrogenase (acetyl-transferring), homodimeric type [Actinomycetota bacterium]MCL5444809.1 pyruvate dehydrogenase (acetyl-transferring), homodimeric type [Actinomycetota bacterium]